MSYARWERTIFDNVLGLQPGAQVTVTDETYGGLAQLFSDREGTVPLSNPFTADASTARAAFHARGGAYRIDVVKGSYSATYRYQPVGLLQEMDLDALLAPG